MSTAIGTCAASGHRGTPADRRHPHTNLPVTIQLLCRTIHLTRDFLPLQRVGTPRDMPASSLLVALVAAVARAANPGTRCETPLVE